MNTFFISPLIPLNFYIIIQKEKNKIPCNKEEIEFISNINQLFDYNKILSDETIKIIKNIIYKISKISDNYKDLNSILSFVNQNTFKEITNYNHIYYNLLIERNYTQIINPYTEDEIQITVGLTDSGPLKKLDVSLFKQLNTDSEKFNYINNLIKDKESYYISKDITQYIMSKSRIDTKINTITKILSNKSILYNLLKDENFIPFSESFETINEDLIQDIINNFKLNSKSKYFVIKPSEGTLSDGVGIFNIDKLDINFIKTWINNPDNNKYSVSEKYTSWILSEFIQSFLWKLNGQNNTSKVFPSLVLKEPQLKFNFNDNIGRINKFRFWALYSIIDNEFTSYLYKDGYCEISLEELTNYSKTQLDPADIETFYQGLLNVEDENPDIFKKSSDLTDEEKKIEASFIGTYLDFARVVNENNFPLGSEIWNNVLMPNMYSIVNILANKMKRFMNCLNKYTLKGSKGCYSFFALDIIIDENGKPWLLETNSRPFIGFGNFFNKYDPDNNHVINVNNVLNSVLGLTTDLINDGGLKNVQYDNFLVTNIEKLRNSNQIYLPLSPGITATPTSKVYNHIYNILDKNNYTAFPYPKFLDNKINKAIGFRGMSPLSKFLISKISDIGKDKFISLMQELYPYDAKLKVLNRISTLGFYLGDKAEMTRILKESVKNWDSIIPYSETINISDMSKEDILHFIQNTPLNNSKIIAKPSYGQQGKGIIISDDVNKLIYEMIKNKDVEQEYVLSKYLDNPYLIKLNKIGVSNVVYNDTYGRKCHLRAYVLVQKIKDKIKVYLYKESLIFCASKEYNSCDTPGANKEYCNLTNLYFGSKYYKDVLNKKSSDAYKDLSGLAKDLISDPLSYNILMNQVKHIIKTTIYAVKDDLICLNYNQNCYQYIAFDLHLENDLRSNKIYPKPWLLEVNSTPGLKAPDYQWESIGGLENFLESILNITIGTKIKKSKQLFEYLPYNKKIKSSVIDKDILFTNNHCLTIKYNTLKEILKIINYPGRSYLNTKVNMCNVLKNISY